MARRCEICGKQTEVGNNVAMRGMAKKDGGVGKKVTGKTKRKFKPNIQKVRTVEGGTVKKVKICTRCLKSGRVQKPAKKPAMSS